LIEESTCVLARSFEATYAVGPSPMAIAVTAAAVVKLHATVPVGATATTWPSRVPTYTVPSFPTVGGDVA
jgi:hypothetical protein